MDWPTAAVELGKILGPAIVTGAVSYYIAKNQLQTKEIEVKGQGDIKARELMFNSYQKRYERTANLDKDFSELVSKLSPLLQKLESKVSLDDLGSIIRVVALNLWPLWQEDIKDLESELKDAGLVAKNQGQIESIKKLLAIDLSVPNSAEMVGFSFEMMKCFIVMRALRGDLLA